MNYYTAGNRLDVLPAQRILIKYFKYILYYTIKMKNTKPLYMKFV